MALQHAATDAVVDARPIILPRATRTPMRTVFHFLPNEAMLVVYSCKYTLGNFTWLAERAGLRVAQSWTDDQRHFSVQWLVVD